MLRTNTLPGQFINLLLILFLLSLAYYAVITHPFLFHDDYMAMTWNKISLRSHGYASPNVVQGRWGAFVLNPLAHYWLSFHTSTYIRFISVLLLGLISFINFRFLTNLGYKKIASLIFSITLATLPPFQAMVYGITSGQYILFAILGAQLSFILLLQKRYFLAAILLMCSQFTYASSTYFLTFLVFYLLSPDIRLDKTLIKRGWCYCAFYIASMLLFFILTIAMDKILGLQQLSNSAAPGRGLSINTDVLGQIYFYLRTVIPKTANLWHIQYWLYPHSYFSIGMSISILLLGIFGLKNLLSQKRSDTLYPHLLFLLAIIIPLTVTHMLAAIPGTWIPYRTLAPHMTILYFLAFWGAYTFLQSRKLLLLVAGMGLIIFSIAYCNVILEKFMVIPNKIERDYVEKSLAGITPQSKNINIAIRRDDNRSSLIGMTIEDGWGLSSTHKGWGMALIMSILRDKGVKIENWTGVDKEITWPNGKLVNISSHDKVPENAYLIDMTKL